MARMLAAVFANGGWVLIAIMLASLVGLAVVIERCWRLLPMRRQFSQAWEEVASRLPRARVGVVRQGLDGRDGPMVRMLGRGLDLAPAGPDRVKEAAFEAAQREVPGIERGLSVLATVAQIAPLLGLLGTVAGLIEAFQAASAAEVSSGVLAGGIYKALGTTAAGLTVAIPAWIAYNSLAGVAAGLVSQLEHAAGELPILLESRRVTKAVARELSQHRGERDVADNPAEEAV